MPGRFLHTVGFDDAPFAAGDCGRVMIVGAVCSGLRLDGVLSGTVERDGDDATAVLTRLVAGSRFDAHVQAVLLQGITVAGFNVVDCLALHRALQRPVITVARKRPDQDSIRRALLEHVPGGACKWRRIEKAGPMVQVGRLFVQHFGISYNDTRALIGRLAVHSLLPEPLRLAHLIAGGIVLGESRHRA